VAEELIGECKSRRTRKSWKGNEDAFIWSNPTGNVEVMELYNPLVNDIH
jgi:hypothetical protein